MSALEKMLQILNTVYPRPSAHALIGALPRISVYPLLHQGSYNQESYIQGFSNSGVHISVSYMTGLCPDFDIDRCSLHSGVQINVSYMTGLWPDVDTDRTILRSGSVLIVNFTSSGYPLLRCWYWPYNVTSMLNPCPNVYTDGRTLHLGVCAQMLISIVNAFVASSGLRLVSYI